MNRFIHKIYPYLFVLVACLAPLWATAQHTQFKKATKLYQAKRYAQAIPHFEGALAKEKNIAMMTKLANCYRLTNKHQKAEGLLSQVVASEKVRPIAYYYYGEVLMSKGDYDTAKMWLHQYNALVPEDEKTIYLLLACDLVKDIQPLFELAPLTFFAHNSDADDNSPVFLDNELVFSSDRNQGIKLLKKKAGWTDRDFLQIYNSSSDVIGQYSMPMPFNRKVNELNKNVANTSFWENKKTGITEIYFARNSHQSSRNNEYNMQLFRGESSNGKTWKNIREVAFSSVEHNYMHPTLSPSGDTLFFVSDRSKAALGTDIYYALRKKNNTWGRPKSLGAPVNTPTHEGFPYMHSDGRLYFCSKGHIGFGGFDIFMTERTAAGEWTVPQNLGKPFNSAADDISICFKKDKQHGAFVSARNGGDDDIYLFEILQQKIPRAAEESLAAIEEAILAENTDKFDRSLIYVEKEAPKTPVILAMEARPKQAENKEEETANKEEKPASIAEEIEDFSSLDEVLPVEYEAPRSKMETHLVGTLKPLMQEDRLYKGQLFRLKSIHYKKYDDTATESIRFELESIVDLLEAYSDLKIEIACHVEALGDDIDNLRLSERRAKAIKQYLIEEGIPSEQLSAKGYGEDFPLNHCTNDEPDCLPADHLENRRVELKIIDF